MLARSSITPEVAGPGLAARLRDGTREAHLAVERGPFIRAFLGAARRPTLAASHREGAAPGRTLDRQLYRAYLVALHALYTSLEAGLERHRVHPVVGPLALPCLYRAPAIAADLQALDERTIGPREPTSEPPGQAASDLAAHLRGLADHDPALLVAHAYTRYLGDLSGGQILRAAAAEILGVPVDGPGLAFYDFPEIADLTACKSDLRARLDALPLAPAEVSAVVAEARDAFARNAAVFAELLPA